MEFFFQEVNYTSVGFLQVQQEKPFSLNSLFFFFLNGLFFEISASSCFAHSDELVCILKICLL